MKNIIFLSLLFISIMSLNAQINNDSLYNIWLDHEQSDSIRTKAFGDYIWNKFLYNNEDSAIILANQLFTYSKKKDIKSSMIAALNLLGNANYFKNNLSIALEYNERSLKLSKSIGDKHEMSASMINIGHIYLELGDYTKSMEHYKHGMKMSHEIKDSLGIAESLNYIGDIFFDQSNHPSALEYYQRSLMISEEMKDYPGIANVLNNIGLIYMDNGDYSKALVYYERSLKIVHHLEDKNSIAYVLSNIGVIYNKKKDYTNALDYQQKSLKMQMDLKDKNGIAYSYSNIGEIFSDQSNYTEAWNYYNNSLKICEELNDSQGIVYSLNNIGNNFLFQNNYNKAVKYCQQAYNISKGPGAIFNQKTSCHCLYQAHKALNNNKKALKYYELMNKFDQSLNKQATSKKLQQMEFAKTMMEDSLVHVEQTLVAKMKHDNEIRKTNETKKIIFGFGIFTLFLAIGFFGRWRFVKKSKAILQIEKDKSENLLLNILPFEIAEELKKNGEAIAREFNEVSILFTDFKDFTKLSEKLSAKELVAEINYCFKAFDTICEKYGIEKIKTIGDSYMAAGGLPVPLEDSTKKTVLAAIEMSDFIVNRKQEREKINQISFEMRVGVHTGQVVAGIVGIKKFQYDIWGDTVNTASRMESHGKVGMVNISQNTYELLKDDNNFTFENRGKIQVKGKGDIDMWFIQKIS